MDGQAAIPRDKHGAPIQNGMGVPAVTPITFLLGSSTKFVDAIDLTQAKFQGRKFHGIMIKNPASFTEVVVSMGEGYSMTVKCNSTSAPEKQYFASLLTSGRSGVAIAMGLGIKGVSTSNRSR